MFIWTEDMIRFLRDASEHSDYHHLLAEYLAKRLPENAPFSTRLFPSFYLHFSWTPRAV